MAHPSRTVLTLLLVDVGFAGAHDREKMGKGAGTGWGDARVHCTGQKRMEGEERLKQLSRAVFSLGISQIPSSSTSLLQLHPHLHQQCLTRLTSLGRSPSYVVAVSWTPCTSHPAPLGSEFSSKILLCLTPFHFLPSGHSPELGPINFDRTSAGILPN